MEQIQAEEQELAERLWNGLERIRGIRVLRMWDTARDRVGVATFTVEGRDAREVADELALRFAVAVRSGAFCAHPLVAHLLGVQDLELSGLFDAISRGEEISVPGAVRASIGIGVSSEAVDRLLDALELIASGR